MSKPRLFQISTCLLTVFALCLEGAVHDPTWKVTTDPGRHIYAITVNAQNLSSNEYLERAECHVALLDEKGTEIAVETKNVTVPIRAGNSRTEEFKIEEAGVVRARGKIMNWEAVPEGSIAAKVANEALLVRHGSTPSDEE